MVIAHEGDGSIAIVNCGSLGMDWQSQKTWHAQAMAHPSATGTKSFTAKGWATRARIVSAAAELMRADGAKATRLEDVLRAASVSNSQLYHYFADKGALVRAVIEHQQDVIVGGQESVLQAVDSMDGLRAWADMVRQAQAATACRGGCPIGSLSSELAETDERLRQGLASGFRRWQDAIGNGLETMRQNGELPPDTNPEDLAIAILSLVQGGLLLSQAQRSTRPLEVALTAALELVQSDTGRRCTPVWTA